MSEPATTPTVWRDLTGASEVASALVELYRQRGDGTYDEVVSQTAHGLQCGALARAAGATDELVVAAFLHDIGHLLLADGAAATDRHHERVGCRFLAHWFGPAVTAPIALHVAAKRYLCATDATYVAQLSAGSVRSLELQGGPLSAAECRAAEARDGFADAVRLRRWDDAAKDPAATTPDLAAMHPLVERVIRPS